MYDNVLLVAFDHDIATYAYVCVSPITAHVKGNCVNQLNNCYDVICFIWHLPSKLSIEMAIVTKCVMSASQRRQRWYCISCVFYKKDLLAILHNQLQCASIEWVHVVKRLKE